jgi:hypothetical protein
MLPQGSPSQDALSNCLLLCSSYYTRRQHSKPVFSAPSAPPKPRAQPLATHVAILSSRCVAARTTSRRKPIPPPPQHRSCSSLHYPTARQTLAIRVAILSSRCVAARATSHTTHPTATPAPKLLLPPQSRTPTVYHHSHISISTHPCRDATDPHRIAEYHVERQPPTAINCCHRNCNIFCYSDGGIYSPKAGLVI